MERNRKPNPYVGYALSAHAPLQYTEEELIGFIADGIKDGEFVLDADRRCRSMLTFSFSIDEELWAAAEKIIEDKKVYSEYEIYGSRKPKKKWKY
jgi:hypothetical protein